MKRTGMFRRDQPLFSKWLPVALAAITLLVTGCPHNQYFVQLKPHGNAVERTLTFYCEDGVNTNTGAPNYQPFGATELAAITVLYPPHGVTYDGLQYVARSEFTNKLPADVGGAGTFTCFTNNFGEAGLYTERFRGNDDLAGMTERRFRAANQLTELLIGWSQKELGQRIRLWPASPISGCGIPPRSAGISVCMYGKAN